jgi:dolichol kinase
LREFPSIKGEIFRKFVHFCGLFYIPSYEIFGKEILFSVLLILFPIVVFLEILRIKKGFFGYLVREYEKKSFGAYVYFLISLIILTYLFPKESAFVAVLTAIVGDGFAGIFRRMGNELLASLSMFFTSTILIYLIGLMSYHSVFAVLVGTTVERIKKINGVRIEDNISVPLSTAIADSLSSLISDLY